MSGVLLLSIRHLLAHRVQAAILALCIAVTAFVPAATQLLTSRYRANLVARGDATPLVAGARGNRFDLTLAALYFRRTELEPIRRAVYDDICADEPGLVIPLNVRFTTRDVPIVGTSIEYLEWRGLAAARGTLPLALGDCVVGSVAARILEVDAGGWLFSDQRELYDISKPPALKMHVAGVLAATGTPDDHVVFVDVKTVWVLEGIAHGHDDAATEVGDDLLIGRTEEHVAVSPAMIEHNQITPETIGTFHVHGDPAHLPLTAVIVAPRSAKAATMLKARLNAAGDSVQMVVPRTVIDELLGFVFRIKRLFDALSVVLLVCTALLGTLVVALTVRIRAPEMATLDRIGCSRFTVAGLYATELVIIVTLGLALAAAAVGVALAVVPSG